MKSNKPLTFDQKIKELRTQHFPRPFELTYQVFSGLKFNTRKSQYFLNNASYIVETLRHNCWQEYLKVESAFMSKAIQIMVNQKKHHIPVHQSLNESIKDFICNNQENLYSLILSNTQSRRSRAGKEFEAIIELLFVGAEIPYTDQSSIGTKKFTEKNLGKLVDLVSPGILEYEINKSNTILVSAKTTLRERWQEVPEEMERTKAKEIYLATLDDKISDSTLNILYEANIHIVTTKKIKENKYNNNRRILSFEELLQRCQHNLNQNWRPSSYSKEKLTELKTVLEKQKQKYGDNQFMLAHYQKRLSKLGIKNSPPQP